MREVCLRHMNSPMHLATRATLIATFALVINLLAISFANAQETTAERTVAPAPASEPVPATSHEVVPTPVPVPEESSAPPPMRVEEPGPAPRPIIPLEPNSPQLQVPREFRDSNMRREPLRMERPNAPGRDDSFIESRGGENNQRGGEGRGRFERENQRGPAPEETELFEEEQEGMEVERARQMARGTERGLKNIARSIARIKKAGGAVPSKYESAVSELTAAIATIKSATERNDELDEAMAVLEEMGEDIREMGPRLGMLEQFPRIVRDATRQAAQARKQLTRSTARAKKAGVDVADIVSSIEVKLAAIDAAIAEAKGSQDPEEAMESLRENVFEATEDVRDEMALLENIANGSRIIKDVEKEIKRIEKEGAALKRKKKDTSTLDDIIGEMKAALAEAKEAMKQRGSDPGELFEAFSDGEALHNDALEELARLRGETTDIDKKFKAPDVSRTDLGASVYLSYLRLKDAVGL